MCILAAGLDAVLFEFYLIFNAGVADCAFRSVGQAVGDVRGFVCRHGTSGLIS